MSKSSSIDFQALIKGPSCSRPVDRVIRVYQQAAAIRNWLPLVRMRKDNKAEHRRLRLVHFRNGLRMYIREGTHDIFTVWEVLLAGSYESIEAQLRQHSGPVTVIDLGAHIGSFSLRALRAIPNVRLESYEPGVESRSILEKNIGLQDGFTSRVTVYADAVGGVDGSAAYHLNPTNTEDSSLYGTGDGVPVAVVSFQTVLARCKYPIALVKIDIEGAENELLADFYVIKITFG